MERNRFLDFFTMSRIVTFMGFLSIVIAAIDPNLFDDVPRVKAAFIILAGLVTAIGRGLFNGKFPPTSGSGMRALLLVPVLGLCLLTTACDDKEMRRLAVTNDRLANSIAAATDVKRELRAINLIDADEARTYTVGLRDFNSAVSQFNVRVRRYEKFDASSKADLAVAFGDVTGAFRLFVDDGTARIKNPQARARITPILAAIESILQEVGRTLGTNIQPLTGANYERRNTNLDFKRQRLVSRVAANHRVGGYRGALHRKRAGAHGTDDRTSVRQSAAYVVRQRTTTA